MINPKKELFIWGPVDGVLIYSTYFSLAIAKLFPKRYGVFWPETVFSLINHKMTFICEYDLLRKAGWRTFERWVLPDKKYNLVRKRYNRAVGQLVEIDQRVIVLSGNSSQPPLKIRGGEGRVMVSKLYQKWQKIYLDFWCHGLVPEIANWGGEKFLIDALARRKITGQEYLHALEVLTAPAKLGFFQEAERDLLRIALKITPLNLSLYKGRNGGVTNFRKCEYGRVKKALALYTKKYFWLHNSYYKTQVLTVRDFAKMLKEEIKKGNVAKRIKAIENGPRERTKTRETMIKKLKFSKREAEVARKLGQTISWQDERKKYIWQANHIIDLWLRKVAQMSGIPFKMCKDLMPKEIEQILAGRELNIRRLSKLRQQSAEHFKKSTFRLVVGRAAKKLSAPFQKQMIGKSREVRGLVVSKGPKVRGRVRIIFSPHKEQKRMRKGDILVTSMTSPDYIVVMRQAAAVVTDTGGMTSHAAVVSRELGIPCIVATKIATQVFKDGDLVEVDAVEGVVKKLK